MPCRVCACEASSCRQRKAARQREVIEILFSSSPALEQRLQSCRRTSGVGGTLKCYDYAKKAFKAAFVIAAFTICIRNDFYFHFYNFCSRLAAQNKQFSYLCRFMGDKTIMLCSPCCSDDLQQQTHCLYRLHINFHILLAYKK